MYPALLWGTLPTIVVVVESTMVVNVAIDRWRSMWQSMRQWLVDGGWRWVGSDVAALSTVGAVGGQWCGGLVDGG